MKHSQNWQQIITKTVFFSFSLPIFLSSAALANTANLNSSQFSTQTNPSELQPESPISQNLNTCYQVGAEYGMYVREEPTVYSEAIAVLQLGQAVTIAPGGTEHWTPISAPIQGYVWGDWLIPCTTR